MKLLVILFIIRIFVRINIFKQKRKMKDQYLSDCSDGGINDMTRMSFC